MNQIPDVNEVFADVKEYVLYMQELGVEFIDADLPDFVLAAAEKAAAKPEKYVPKESELPAVNKDRPAKRSSRIEALPSLKKRTVENIPNKIEMPKTQKAPAKETTTAEDPHDQILKQVAVPVAETIQDIRNVIGDCKRCALCEGRTNIVHSTGNFNAELMFVGEAPGADEDEQGLPFVGRAGKLLTKIIESIGVKREEVFIGNINRCRPPGNRAPVPDETAQCRPFLLREIEVIKPKVIVVLGATAAHNLLQVKTPIGQLRGNFHDYFGVKVMPTFHPAYLLRDPHKKREVWEDMKKVRDLLTKEEN